MSTGVDSGIPGYIWTAIDILILSQCIGSTIFLLAAVPAKLLNKTGAAGA